jgi:hypothetical protein
MHIARSPPDSVCLECEARLSDAVILFRGDFMAGFSLVGSVTFDE